MPRTEANGWDFCTRVELVPSGHRGGIGVGNWAAVRWRVDGQCELLKQHFFQNRIFSYDQLIGDVVISRRKLDVDYFV